MLLRIVNGRLGIHDRQKFRGASFLSRIFFAKIVPPDVVHSGT